MAWIEPFEFKTVIVNMFAGNPDIFIAIALITISAMSAYFRMSVVTMSFMIGIFILMFSSEVVQSPMITVFGIIAGLVIGLLVNRITKR